MVAGSISTTRDAPIVNAKTRPVRAALRIPAAIYADLRRHAARMPNEEVCGLLAGRCGVVDRLVEVANIADDRARRFEMDPAAQIAAFRDIDASGQSLVAVYHSHPRGPNYPSAVDLDLHFYPEAMMAILCPWRDDRLAVRVFAVREGWIVEQAMDVV